MGVTIYDIAERAEVSIATVSRVFNGHPRVSKHTRQRVLDVARTLNYQPHASARSLARRSTHLISAVIPMMTNYFFMEMMRGVKDGLDDTPYDLLVYAARTPDHLDSQLDRALQRGRADALLLGSTPLTDERIERLRRAPGAVVLVDAAHPDFDSVAVDNQRGGYDATCHLIDQNRSRVALILAHPASKPAADRRLGYEQALRERGLDIDEAYIVVSADEKQHGYTEAEGYAAMQQLLRLSEPPDAVFVASDIQALGALRALREAGKSVPGDVALVGFDDIRVSAYVGLCTMHQPMYEMGRHAIRKLLERLDHPEQPVAQTVYTPKIVHRETSQPGTHA